MPASQPIPTLAWFDIDDPASPSLDDLAQRYGLHPLEIEDCRHGRQRAKTDEHANYIFCVLKHLHPDRGINFDDLGIFVGRDFIITVHTPTDSINPVLAVDAEQTIAPVDR